MASRYAALRERPRARIPSMAMDADATLIQAFDRLSTGVLVLDAQGRVVRANPLAVAMLDSCPELSLVDERLVATSAEVADAIDDRIRTVTRVQPIPAPANGTNGHAANGTANGKNGRRGKPVNSGDAEFLKLLGDEPHQTLLLRFVPSNPERSEPRPVVEPTRRDALVFLSDGRSAVDREALRHVHGLTRAEAQLASGLVAGLNLAEAAASRGVEIETTRTQLKSVLRKVGARSQADLVRQLLTGVARVSEPTLAEEPNCARQQARRQAGS